jgi:Glutathione S-transferase N-terminal domain
MKTEILLKMANLPYRTDKSGFLSAPKGKLPYIDDDDEIVADSNSFAGTLRRNTASTSMLG